MIKRKSDFANELREQMNIKPYSKISISDICDKLNCSRQSFYYYFHTLDDCLADYLNEMFKVKIIHKQLITSLFDFVTSNEHFVKECNNDVQAKKIFWDKLYLDVKVKLGNVFEQHINEYIPLYPSQKEAITSFYAAGILKELEIYLSSTNRSSKEFIQYCMSIMGGTDDHKAVMLRIKK